MTLIVGIDPSAKKIAIVAAVPILHVSYVSAQMLYKSDQRQTPQSIGKALDVMRDFLEWADGVAPNGERLAWVEDPLVGRGGVVPTIKQAYVGGIIRGTLANAGFKVYGVNQSSWKKAVLGNGRAEKAQIKQHVKAMWPKIAGQIADDSDLADAAAINLYGQTVLDRGDAIAGRDADTSRRSLRG